MTQTTVDETGMTQAQITEFHKLCKVETVWDAYDYALQTRGD